MRTGYIAAVAPNGDPTAHVVHLVAGLWRTSDGRKLPKAALKLIHGTHKAAVHAAQRELFNRHKRVLSGYHRSY